MMKMMRMGQAYLPSQKKVLAEEPKSGEKGKDQPVRNGIGQAPSQQEMPSRQKVWRRMEPKAGKEFDQTKRKR